MQQESKKKYGDGIERGKQTCAIWTNAQILHCIPFAKSHVGWPDWFATLRKFRAIHIAAHFHNILNKTLDK